MYLDVAMGGQTLCSVPTEGEAKRRRAKLRRGRGGLLFQCIEGQDLMRETGKSRAVYLLVGV